MGRGGDSSARGATVASAILLVVALAANYASLVPMVSRSHGDFDAIHLYFPLARGLLEHGLAFFADERSVQAPPFSWIYPLLLGVSLPAVKVANAVLSGITLLAVFRSAWLMHSRAAGVIAAMLFAVSPTLRPHLATPITEGPYLLLSTVWFWGMAEWLTRGRRGALVLSAVALSLAALTRATMFYWIVLLAAGSATVAWRARGPARHQAVQALLAFGIALLPILAFILKNALLFGFPFYTTGGANALYLGNNPLTGGYDPNYLGLHFDVGAIARDQSHLTLEADRLLGGAARLIFADKSAAFLAAMHAEKLAAFLFVTGAETDALIQRCWRIALFVMAAGALPRRRAQTLHWLLFATMAYQVAIHVPVLYVHRYSVDALDGWLVIAAGVGIARFGLAGAPLRLAAASLVAVAGMALGAYLLLNRPGPMPDVFAVARLRVWQAAEVPRTFAGPGARAELPFGNAPWLSPANNHVLVLDAVNAPNAAGRGCDPLRVSFRPSGAAAFSPAIRFRIPADGSARRQQFGTIPLGLAREGTLRLEADCPDGAKLTLDGLALYAALGATDYRSRFLGEPVPMPMER